MPPPPVYPSLLLVVLSFSTLVTHFIANADNLQINSILPIGHVTPFTISIPTSLCYFPCKHLSLPIASNPPSPQSPPHQLPSIVRSIFTRLSAYQLVFHCPKPNTTSLNHYTITSNTSFILCRYRFIHHRYFQELLVIHEFIF